MSNRQQQRIAGRNVVSILAASTFVVGWMMLTAVLLETVPAVDVWFTQLRWIGAGLLVGVFAVSWYLNLEVVR